MTESLPKPVCGIVMPISGMGDCTESHWSDVLRILLEAIEAAGFEGNLVSNADDVGIIHKRIIQNLYDNPVVVCDVSAKNPNVMFELGLRLAFDKPTVIIKDDQTTYSFDTSAIEHLEYPRDLRFSRIVDFKAKLADKIAATHKRATTDANYTTFLKHFGEFTVAKLEQKEVSGQEFILEELRSMRSVMRRLENSSLFQRDLDNAAQRRGVSSQSADLSIVMNGVSKNRFEELVLKAKNHPDVLGLLYETHGGDDRILKLTLRPGASPELVEIELLNNQAPVFRASKKDTG